MNEVAIALLPYMMIRRVRSEGYKLGRSGKSKEDVMGAKKGGERFGQSARDAAEFLFVSLHVFGSLGDLDLHVGELPTFSPRWGRVAWVRPEIRSNGIKNVKWKRKKRSSVTCRYKGRYG